MRQQPGSKQCRYAHSRALSRTFHVGHTHQLKRFCLPVTGNSFCKTRQLKSELNISFSHHLRACSAILAMSWCAGKLLPKIFSNASLSTFTCLLFSSITSLIELLMLRRVSISASSDPTCSLKVALVSRSEASSLRNQNNFSEGIVPWQSRQP